MTNLTPDKSPSFNAGWEAYFIDRDLQDNPNQPGTDYHKDWVAGFESARSNAALTGSAMLSKMKRVLKTD